MRQKSKKIEEGRIKTKMKKQTKTNQNKGITLIALVVTIIVLLILAAVSITLLFGEGGLIEAARNTRTKIDKMEDLEKIEFALADAKIGQYLHGTSYEGALEIYSFRDYGISVIKKSGNNWKIQIEDRTYTVDILTGEKQEEKEIEFDNILEDLKNNTNKYVEKASALGQTKTGAVGIGTDGKVVNLDLWNYILTGDGNSISLGYYVISSLTYAYAGEIINGEIDGCIPQYIYYIEEDNVYPVSILNRMGSVLTISPELPTTLKRIESYAFNGCEFDSILLPPSVEYVGYRAFADCSSLQTIYISSEADTSNWSSSWKNGCDATIVYY